VEKLLRTLPNTAPGPDNLPAWIFRNCSVELAGVITDLFNQSIMEGTVPDQWHKAIVTPVPKINKPMHIADYRPISVTSLLSRLLEGIVVRKYIRPHLYGIEDTADQYAYRPTGSTTCAFVHLLHKVTLLLENCNYVRCLLIDFSKAFDIVNRTLLLQKMKSLNLPGNIMQWIANFLSNREQVTKCGNSISESAPVNLGVVQGSAVGPTLFTVLISDLKPISNNNDMVKYADDATLVVPETSDVDIATEFAAIKSWAERNEMKINFAKTKEIVFHRPRPAKPILPPPLTNSEKVTCAKLLGITIKHNLSFSEHVSNLLSRCNQRMFLLRSLRNRGLPPKLLEMVFNAILLSVVTYAISSWGGFASMAEQRKLDGILMKCVKYGYCTKTKSLLGKADRSLFMKAQNPAHCLFKLLPSTRSTVAVLRDRGHPFVLPTVNRVQFKRSFIIRALFDFV
jgi:hypothetical protein